MRRSSSHNPEDLQKILNLRKDVAGELGGILASHVWIQNAAKEWPEVVDEELMVTIRLGRRATITALNQLMNKLED